MESGIGHKVRSLLRLAKQTTRRKPAESADAAPRLAAARRWVTKGYMASLRNHIAVM